MKMHYVKLEFLALLFLCTLSYLYVGHAEVVWSDDFNDEDYNGWMGVMGFLSAKNGSLHSTVSGEIIPGFEILSGAYYPSTVAVGTWSFDFLSNGSRAPEFAVEFVSLGQYKWEMGEEITKCYGFYAGWFQDGKYELYKNVQFPLRTNLQFFSPSYSIPNEWHHVDITRSEDGRIVVYVDGELTHDVVDKEHKESKYFGVHLEHSTRGTAYIDNIIVSNTVDIEPPPKKNGESVPGFPLESVTIGTIFGVFILLFLTKRR